MGDDVQLRLRCGAPTHANERRGAPTLKTALTVDGSGVALLTGIAAFGLRSRRRSRTDQGTALTATVGLAGFGLAVAAVRLATRHQADSAAARRDIATARHLIVAGFAINTV